MSTRRRPAAALLLLVGTGVTAFPEGGQVPARVAPTAVDHDLARVRDVFRYADAPAPDFASTGASPEAERAAADERRAPPSPPPARLVGFVERADRVVAALSIEGEVLLLAEGQGAAGFTVLEVTAETVRLRTPDGAELTLALP